MGRVAAGRLISLAAGVVPANLALPGGIEGRQRVVRISLERIRHIAEQRPEWRIFCLTHMAHALRVPEYLGYRPEIDRCGIEFVRRVGADSALLLVAVKFLDDTREAWVATAHRLSDGNLTRRIRNGTMRTVDREP